MHNVIFFDDDGWESLLPLTYTKPSAELRVGIQTIREKWMRSFEGRYSYICQEYLSEKFPIYIDKENLIINGRLLPNDETVEIITQLQLNEALIFNDIIIAARLEKDELNKLSENIESNQFKAIDISEVAKHFIDFIDRPNDIFSKNGIEISKDFNHLTKNRQSQEIPSHVRVNAPHNVFIEKGAVFDFCILNAVEGPIYIGKDAKILDNAVVKGPFALGEKSVVKMSAKIYGETSTGPHCKIGGEISNSVIQGYSNKGHDGYLGNAVIGEWCNLGADTNNSNLKNNYEEVKLWNYRKEKFEKTGVQFCGLIMGDHSKSAINTMFNTGTVTGVACNIFGYGFVRNFVPSFSWGGYQGIITHTFDKAIKTADLMMSRRGILLNEIDIKILKHIFEQSAKFRSWEK